MFRHACRLSAALATLGYAAILLSSSAPLDARATLEVVAAGLNNPRGLNFGPEGGLYVAEAGSGGAGPCIINSNNVFVCYGATGSITRITLRGVPSQTRVVTGLPSLAAPTGAGAGSSSSGTATPAAGCGSRSQRGSPGPIPSDASLTGGWGTAPRTWCCAAG